MKIGIIKGQYGRVSEFNQRFSECAKNMNVESKFLDINSPQFWDQIVELDAIICRWIQFDQDRQMARTILPIIEKEYGKAVFPNECTCFHYDDKIRQYYVLKAHNMPIIESFVFWDPKPALEWSRTVQYPLVFKLKSGAGSNSVLLVHNAVTARKLIYRMFGRGILPGRIPLRSATQWKDFSLYRYLHHKGGNLFRRIHGEDAEPCWIPNKNYVLFQKFLPGNDFDTRVTVIGDRAYAFRRFNRKNDFRSSGSGKLEMTSEAIDLQHVRKAFEISHALGLQSMAYDFLYNAKGDSEFCEMSYTYVDRALYDCPGYWDKDLIWHEGHYWPQEFILEDLLKGQRLRPDNCVCERSW